MADKDAIYDRVAGKVKETAGKVTGDKETETEGKLRYFGIRHEGAAAFAASAYTSLNKGNIPCS